MAPSDTGSIRVAASTGGIDLDPDGYAVSVDGGQSQLVGINASATFADVAVGDHDVELTGVAANCDITNANPRRLTVSAGFTQTTTFQVTCASTSVIEITASTTGIHPDADGYIVTLDDGQGRPIAANGTEVFAGLASGDHEVELSGVATHCALEGANPRTLAVSIGGTVSTTFNLDCVAALEGRIAFERGGDIYVMDADGSNPVNLTMSGERDSRPAWSPDGTRIAFASDRDNVDIVAGRFDIFVMNADGSNPVNLTTSGNRQELNPAWSPDGTRIAFMQGGDAGSLEIGIFDIYVMDADGSNPVNLTMSGNHSEAFPAWSPDGTRIAFSSIGGISVMDADGSNVVRLISNSQILFNFGPAWSPDGTRIAFSQTDDFGFPVEIYVMDADGSNVVNLTMSGNLSLDPEWSPDGTRIAFGRGGNIYVMDADGSNLIRLTDGSSDQSPAPAWGP